MRRFTLTTSWNALAVELSQTFQAAHYLVPSQLSYGLGEPVAATGVPLLSNQFQGYQWQATVRATVNQKTVLDEMVTQFGDRNKGNLAAYLVLKDEVNRYPATQFTKNSRAVVPSSQVTINGINTAYLTFPCVVTEYVTNRVLRIDSEYDVQLQLVEVP